VVYVSRQLGHSSPSITVDIYGHLFTRRATESGREAALDGVVTGGVGEADGEARVVRIQPGT
jgi:hypothetical protein